jgi:lipoprotein-releasing system permease protein
MLPFQIAFRFLRSSLGQTILIVIGISVGVSVQVFIGSLIGGLQQDLVNTTIGNSSQITISHEEDFITDYENVKNQIDEIEGISVVSYAFDQSGTMIIDDETAPILLRGFDFDLSENIYETSEKLVEGVLPSKRNEIAVSTAFVEEYNLAIDDVVKINVPLRGEEDMVIKGIYDFNVGAVNNLWVFTTLDTVQTLVEEGLVVTSIETQLDDVFLADTLALEVQNKLENNSLEVTNWIDENGDLLVGLEAQSSSSLMIQVFVTISVVLGITSVLAITVIQKSKQIGILKAMGIEDRDASLIFLSEGFLLGILGAIGGVLLGLLLSYVFSTFALDEAGNPVVPLLIEPTFIAISALVAVFSASFASVIPARKSSKLSVIEVIRNG